MVVYTIVLMTRSPRNPTIFSTNQSYIGFEGGMEGEDNSLVEIQTTCNNEIFSFGYEVMCILA